MSYRNKGQNKFFDYLEKNGKMPKRKMRMAMAEDGDMEKPHMYLGGKVAPGVAADQQDDDLEMWAEEHYDLDDEHYCNGGSVRKYSAGGSVEKSMAPVVDYNKYEQEIDPEMERQKRNQFAKGGMVKFANAIRRHRG